MKDPPGATIGRPASLARPFVAELSNTTAPHDHQPDGPLLDRQPLEASLQLVAVGQVAGRVFGCRTVNGQDVDLDRALASPARLVVARIDQKPLEPGVEAGRIPEAANIAPGMDEALLYRVLAPVPIVEDPEGQREQSVIRGPGEHLECLVVAALSPPDQVTLHRRPAMGVPSALLKQYRRMGRSGSLDLRCWPRLRAAGPARD
jgi:hypothetical protein